MLKLTINGKIIEVEEGITVLQACALAGNEIPHFCFHERLNIAGNCRMCLVEIEKAPKLVASCAMPIADGMVIHTNSEKVEKSRHNVMEMLLINHPLDCPICDKGGECDLQDQSYKYGLGRNSFAENKRAVKDKYMGPLIKPHMTRCIHCTRCIRFATEVAGVEEMGAIGRGEHMEVVSYLEKAITSELSGNMIDLCPVGALTSKPYAYKARSWELNKTESIDVLDSMGSNIRIDARGLEVMRILPKINDDINEEWITDKARFSYDGLKCQRLDRPYIRKDGRLHEASWEEALNLTVAKMHEYAGREMAAIAGYFSNVESLLCLKKLFKALGSNNIDANQHGYKLDNSSRGNYLFNTTINGIEQADLCLLIGANPREMAPVLNSRIGRMQRQGTTRIYRIGARVDQTYKIIELGSEIKVIKDVTNRSSEFSQQLAKAQRPMVIVGDGVYARDDGYAVLALIHELVEQYNIVRDGWNGFNILHNHASMVGSLDIGFTPTDSGSNVAEILAKAEQGAIKLVYLLGSDEIDMSRLKSAFVIYQGHHGDRGASSADVILPSAAYTEQDGTYVNLEGRPQLARRAVMPPGLAMEDWRIIKDIAAGLNIDLPQSLAAIRRAMAEESAVFASIDQIIPGKIQKFQSSEQLRLEQKISQLPINYYMTDSISRASMTMAKCSKSRDEMKEVA